MCLKNQVQQKLISAFISIGSKPRMQSSTFCVAMWQFHHHPANILSPSLILEHMFSSFFYRTRPSVGPLNDIRTRAGLAKARAHPNQSASLMFCPSQCPNSASERVGSPPGFKLMETPLPTTNYFTGNRSHLNHRPGLPKAIKGPTNPWRHLLSFISLLGL